MPEQPALVRRRAYYRVVKSDPPTLVDFTSNASARRRLEHPTPERQRLWEGLSSWATEAQARRTARRFPRSGQWIAVLIVPAGSSITVEKTLGPGHYTLWGTPDEIARCVVSVVPV